MDHRRFDAIIRALPGVPSRRAVTRNLLGAGLAAVIGRRPAAAEAKKTRKRRRKRKSGKGKGKGKDQLATCACRTVGQACTSVSQCCSGICQGPPGQRTCRAHGTGTCDQDAAGVCAGDVESCSDQLDCLCFRTTAGSNFCASATSLSDDCTDCETDADCEALGYHAGSACVPYTQGDCAGSCPSNRTCKSPCGKIVPIPRAQS